jgi:hypothetical protein
MKYNSLAKRLARVYNNQSAGVRFSYIGTLRMYIIEMVVD